MEITPPLLSVRSAVRPQLTALFLCLVLAGLPGCWLFESQRIVLDPKDPTVAALIASSVDEEQLRAGLETYLGAQLQAVETTVQDGVTNKVVAVMVPAVNEAFDKAVSAGAKAATSDPTVPGLLGALVAALAAAGGVVAGRAQKRLPKGAKVEAQQTGMVVGGGALGMAVEKKEGE